MCPLKNYSHQESCVQSTKATHGVHLLDDKLGNCKIDEAVEVQFHSRAINSQHPHRKEIKRGCNSAEVVNANGGIKAH